MTFTSCCCIAGKHVDIHGAEVGVMGKQHTISVLQYDHRWGRSNLEQKLFFCPTLWVRGGIVCSTEVAEVYVWAHDSVSWCVYRSVSAVAAECTVKVLLCGAIQVIQFSKMLTQKSSLMSHQQFHAHGPWWNTLGRIQRRKTRGEKLTKQ